MKTTALLLGRRLAEETVPKRHRHTIRWTSPEGYLEEAGKARERALAPWRSLVTECAGADLVSPEEAETVKPGPEIGVRDRRTDKTVPLPELP